MKPVWRLSFVMFVVCLKLPGSKSKVWMNSKGQIIDAEKTFDLYSRA